MSDIHEIHISEALRFHSSDPRVLSLLDASLGRLLREEVRKGCDWTPRYSAELFARVADWLSVSVLDDAVWLSDLDADGVPERLAALGSTGAAARAAEDFFRKRAKARVGEPHTVEHEVVAYEFADGFRIVRMLTSAALRSEREAVGHYGDVRYFEDKRRSRRNKAFYSLRDRHNFPRVSMEVLVDERLVRYLDGARSGYGRGGKNVAFEYLEKVAEFAEAAGLDLSTSVPVSGEVERYGLETYDNGNPPDHLKVMVGGPWLPVDLEGQGIRVWPRVVEVFGDAVMDFLSGSGPQQLLVHGRLRVMRMEAGHRVERLHADILDISNSVGDFLPAAVTVGETLLAKGSDITSLPAGISVSGKVDLSSSPLRTLPADLKCLDLDISDTDVTAIPPGVSVRGSINAAGSALRVLPRGFVVPGSLDIARTEVRVLPPRLTCGSLDISRTGTTYLPQSLLLWSSLKASGSALRDFGAVRRLDELDIDRCRIASLPVGMRVGRLRACDMPLPLDLFGAEVTDELVADGTVVAAFSDALCVSGLLSFRGSTLPVFPLDLRCDLLDIERAVVDALPLYPQVARALNAGGSTVSVVHDLSAVMGAVNLADTAVAELPEGLCVGGSLYLERTALRALPARLRVGYDLVAPLRGLVELGDDIAVGRNADFTGSGITPEIVRSSRFSSASVFGQNGLWVVGYVASGRREGWKVKAARAFSDVLRAMGLLSTDRAVSRAGPVRAMPDPDDLRDFWCCEISPRSPSPRARRASRGCGRGVTGRCGVRSRFLPEFLRGWLRVPRCLPEATVVPSARPKLPGAVRPVRSAARRGLCLRSRRSGRGL